MNILILTSVYPHKDDDNPDRTKVVALFAKEWIKQGHRVLVLVSSAAFPAPYYKLGRLVEKNILKRTRLAKIPNPLWTKRFSWNDDGVAVENLPMRKLYPYGRFSNRTLAKQLSIIKDTLLKRQFVPDVITGHWLNPQLLLIPALSQAYGAKSAFVFHSDYDKAHYSKFNVQQYINDLDSVGFRSQSAMEAASEYMRFSKPPFVCFSGLPDSAVAQAATPDKKRFDSDTLSVVTAGRLVPYKRMDAVVQAIALAFPDGGANLSIAGEGPMSSSIISCARECGVSDRVSLLGRVRHEELLTRLRDADVFALISENEVFGLVYLEAMLQGCIVVASRFGGADGIIQDGVNGFLCRQGDAQELGGILKHIQSLPEAQKRSIAELAIQTAKQYTVSSTAADYLSNITKP